MEKRLPLALFLSFLVLFGYMLLKGEPEDPAVDAVGAPAAAGAAGAAGTDSTPGQPTSSEAPSVALPVPELGATTEEWLDIEVGQQAPAGEEPRAGHYFARFSNRGARLESLLLGDYFTQVGLDEAQRADRANWLPLLESVETLDGTSGSLLLKTGPSSEALAPGGLDQALWVMEELDGPSGVRFTYAPGTGVVFRKTITFEPGTWHIRVRLELENRSAGVDGKPVDFVFTPAGVVPPELAERFYAEPQAVAAGRDGGKLEFDFKTAQKADARGRIQVPAPLVFGGIHNKYFAFLLRESGDTQFTLSGANYRPVFELPGDPSQEARKLLELDIPLRLKLPGAGGANSYEYVVYAGPKEKSTLVGDFEPFEVILDEDLGFFTSIGRALVFILRMFHGLVGNWGLAIIMLTLCVRMLLFPLNRRSQTAMARYQKKMKRVQPRLEEVKKKYANDPTKQREAQARIMQEEGAFPPLGGCLPIFFQMPIFFGLFSALRTSFDLRQEPFYGWIKDLSVPDHLLRLGLDVPFIDLEYLNVLPILMVVMWILQQKGMPKPTDEQAARMQKMMTFMPIMFGFMLYGYAAGLSLYMITTSTFGIIEQRVIKKAWPIDDTEVVKKKKSGCAPLAGVMENMAEKQREQVKRVEGMKAQQKRQGPKRKKKR